MLAAGVVQVLASQLAAFLALLFAAAAIHKALRPRRALHAVREFARVPHTAAAGALLGAGLVEGIAAALLLTPAYRPAGAYLASALLGAYLALLVRAIAQGRRDVDCGCSFAASGRRLGAFEIGRNGLLLVLTLAVAVVSPGEEANTALSQLLPGFALLALYGALDQVMGLQPMRNGAVF